MYANALAFGRDRRRVCYQRNRTTGGKTARTSKAIREGQPGSDHLVPGRHSVPGGGSLRCLFWDRRGIGDAGRVTRHSGSCVVHVSARQRTRGSSADRNVSARVELRVRGESSSRRCVRPQLTSRRWCATGMMDDAARPTDSLRTERISAAPLQSSEFELHTCSNRMSRPVNTKPDSGDADDTTS